MQSSEAYISVASILVIRRTLTESVKPARVGSVSSHGPGAKKRLI